MAKKPTSAGRASQTAPALSGTFTVPLSALVLSDEGNVRSASTITSDGIEQMASMLEASGQLYPLIVSKGDGETYTVHAGQRRTRGFLLLQKNGKITPDHLIDVRQVDASIGVDMSLVENLSQEPMHPADEYRAFQKLADKGASVEQIAKAYGCKVLQVKRRMKLANVHPELLEMFRSGDIHLDQVVALAGCDDQERQLQIWNSLPTWGRSDQQIRRRVVDDDIPADDPRVKLVGLDAYVQAGGGVREDLFSDDEDTTFLTDAGLLEMLLSEKVEAVAEPLRSQGWAWVEVLQSYGYEERQLYKQYPTVYRPETPEQTARRIDLEAQIEQLEAQADAINDKEEEEDGDEGKIDAIESQIEALRKQLDAIEAERVDLNGVDMLTAGVIVFVDDDEIVTLKPMIKAADMKAKGAAIHSKAGGEAAEGDKAEPTEAISERLMKNLTAQRTGAIQACMLKNERVTLAALAANMAKGEFGKTHWADSVIKVSCASQAHILRDASPTFQGSPADEAVMKVWTDWAGKLPAQDADYLAWFIQQPQQVSLDMITFVTALSVNAIRLRPESADPAKPLASALGLDMRQWWTPTRANYLDLVPKAKMIEAVREAHGGPLAAPDWEKLKKGDVIDRADAELRDTGWLPLPLR